MVFGVELIDRSFAGIPGKVWCAVGVIVLFAYFSALWMNFLLPDRETDDPAADAPGRRWYEPPDGACEPVYLYAE